MPTDSPINSAICAESATTGYFPARLPRHARAMTAEGDRSTVVECDRRSCECDFYQPITFKEVILANS